MYTFQEITPIEPSKQKVFAPITFGHELAIAFPSQPSHAYFIDFEVNENSYEVNIPRAELPEEWEDEEYREAYMLASIEQGVAWKIRINREDRGLSQADLANLIGSKPSSISRMEDPEYGKHSLSTLIKLANAFKCALSVKFIPYSKLVEEDEDLSPQALFAAPYESERYTLQPKECK